MKKKIILGSIFGNMIEAYDLTICAIMAKFLSSHFFGAENEVNGVLYTFCILSISYLARPIGAIVFGYISDNFGRKKTLVYSLIIMSLSTFFIAIIPGYNLIGWVAYSMFLLIKMIQGVASGGEYMGSIVFLVESSEKNRKNTMGSWGAMGMNAGMLLATCVLILFSNFNPIIPVWRIALLASIVGGILGLWLRVRLPETLPFIRQNSIENKASVRHLLKDSFLAFKANLSYSLAVTGLCWLGFCSTYLIFIYGPVHMSVMNHLPLVDSFKINAISLSLIVVLIPVFGHLADRFGKRNLLLVSSFSFLSFSYPYFRAVQFGSTHEIIVYQMILAASAAILYGAIPVLITASIPTKIRCTLSSLQYSISACLFGGTAPIIAITLTNHFHNSVAPAFYLIFCSAIGIASSLYLKRRRSATVELDFNHVTQ